MSVLINAAAVLRCFDTQTPNLTVTDVVRRLDLPKANVSRLMKAMREAGLLETVGRGRQHRPGRFLLDLAAAFRSSSRLINRAADVVAAVSGRFGHTGYVSIRDGRDVTAAVDFEGTNSLRVVSSLGRRLHAHCSATGRTMLARLSDREVRSLYPDDPAVEALLQRLRRIRAEGFDISSQESTRGVDAVAVAVGDPSTEEVVSLCIVYPHMLVDAAGRDAIVAALAEGAAAIAREVGDTGFIPPVIAQEGLLA
ncbi:IclR family transcriptional regulator [Aureimonas populi]|uniref:IclR family transcriptional regulator n=1 Tax=Aureimonas populi TaxID=1701758 RepID=A0ABW5CIX7_9HYPH|nr:IclR family transcriptional regulator [Aureimonas populi]